MVYIDKKYPSQQGSIKRGLGEAFSLVSKITFILQIICFVVMCIKADSAMANNAMESVKYLWNTFTALIIIGVLAYIGTFVFSRMAKKIRSNLIAPTYIIALNGVFGLVVLVMALIFIF